MSCEKISEQKTEINIPDVLFVYNIFGYQGSLFEEVTHLFGNEK